MGLKVGKPFKLSNGQLLLSTEAPGGFYNAQQLKKIAALCDGDTTLAKATEDQRLALLVVPEKAAQVAQELKAVGLGVRHYQDGLHQPTSCLGELCPEHLQDAMGAAMDLTREIAGVALGTALKIGINGCARCCLATHTLDVSIVGDSSGYRLCLGGKNSQIPEMASFMAEGIPAAKLPKLVAKVVSVYKELAQKDESFQDVMERAGSKRFIEALAPYSQDAHQDDPFAGPSESPVEPGLEALPTGSADGPEVEAGFEDSALGEAPAVVGPLIDSDEFSPDHTEPAIGGDDLSAVGSDDDVSVGNLGSDDLVSEEFDIGDVDPPQGGEPPEMTAVDDASASALDGDDLEALSTDDTQEEELADTGLLADDGSSETFAEEMPAPEPAAEVTDFDALGAPELGAEPTADSSLDGEPLTEEDLGAVEPRPAPAPRGLRDETLDELEADVASLGVMSPADDLSDQGELLLSDEDELSEVPQAKSSHAHAVLTSNGDDEILEENLSFQPQGPSLEDEELAEAGDATGHDEILVEDTLDDLAEEPLATEASISPSLVAAAQASLEEPPATKGSPAPQMHSVSLEDDLAADEVGEAEADAFEQKLADSIAEEEQVPEVEDLNSAPRLEAMKLVEAGADAPADGQEAGAFGDTLEDLAIDDAGDSGLVDSGMDDADAIAEEAPASVDTESQAAAEEGLLPPPTPIRRPSPAEETRTQAERAISKPPRSAAAPNSGHVFTFSGIDMTDDGKVSLLFSSGARMAIDPELVASGGRREFRLAGQVIVLTAAPGGVQLDVDGMQLFLPGQAA